MLGRRLDRCHRNVWKIEDEPCWQTGLVMRLWSRLLVKPTALQAYIRKIRRYVKRFCRLTGGRQAWLKGECPRKMHRFSSDMSWLPGPTSLHHNGLYDEWACTVIMKAKSVYNNLKQYSSRSCGIEDNASFAPTNGRDRTDRQDRETYRNPKRTL